MKQPWENLASTELDWKDFFHKAPDLFCIIGPDGCFLELNLAWSSQMGWTVDELLSQPVTQFVHPEDVDSLEVIDLGQEAFLENRYRHQDGSYRWLSWSMWRSQQGLTYAVARDITDHRREVEVLKSERQNLYGLLDQLPAFLYLQPRDYGVGFYNQRFKEIFGEPQGRRCYETIAGLKQPCSVCPTFRVFDTNTPQIWEWLDSRTGRTYQIYDYPFKGMNGEPLVVEMGLDITAVKKAEAELRSASAEIERRNEQLEASLYELQRAQMQLVQTEKMSSLGQLVAGVAHEINNPINFISGNLTHLSEYCYELLGLIELYQQQYTASNPVIQDRIEQIDLEFLSQDLPKTLSSVKLGANRICEIVLSLRNFSRLDEAEMKHVNIHEGIDSTLLILHSRLKAEPEQPGIEIIKDYGDLPLVECYAGQLNQVFMNILSNAIDALQKHDLKHSPEEIKKHPSTITIRTMVRKDQSPSSVEICIKDNGPGMTDSVKARLFDPFFTTKPVGQGTGLGLSISYQIVVQKHGGKFKCISSPGQGAEFWIEIPIQQTPIELQR